MERNRSNARNYLPDYRCDADTSWHIFKSCAYEYFYTAKDEYLTSNIEFKGEGVLMIYDSHTEYRNRDERHFLALIYYAETVGRVSEETINNIAEQEECRGIEA